jgi:micrococcal nuclease
MEPSYTYAATVVRVVDGDTLDVLLDYGDHLTQLRRLRLRHVDAHEHGTRKGEQATALVQQLLPIGGRAVVTTSKPDKYGRQLAVVQSPSGLDVATELLLAGLAVPYEGGTRSSPTPARGE